MKKSTYMITRFDIENCEHDGFYVEVFVNDKDRLIEFTLCREGYGTKQYMFGLMKKFTTEEDWEYIIERNIDKYINEYIETVY